MARKRPASANDLAIVQLVRALVEVLLQLGLAPEDVQAMVKSAAAKQGSRKKQTAQLTAAAERVAHALFVWHTEPNFLDAQGAPKALRTRGKTCSLEALLRHCYGSGFKSNDIEFLTKSASVTEAKAGQYLPSDHFVNLRDNRELLLYQACLTAARLLRTALQNANTQKPNDILIERSAFVPKLPVSLLPQFRRYINRQGAELVMQVDKWLESRQPQGTSKKSRPRSGVAGIHVFGFTG